MNYSEYISFIALIVSVISLFKSFYHNSDLEAKHKGMDVLEIEYHEYSSKNGIKKVYVTDRDDGNIDFFIYEKYVLVRNNKSGIKKIIKIENIDIIKYRLN